MLLLLHYCSETCHLGKYARVAAIGLHVSYRYDRGNFTRNRHIHGQGLSCDESNFSMVASELEPQSLFDVLFSVNYLLYNLRIAFLMFMRLKKII